MSYNDQNIFAKILRGELPAHKVYEDDHCLAIMDIMPQVPGHTLVLPKTACENLLDAPDESLRQTIVIVRDIARAVQLAFEAKGVMVMQLNGAAAGQTVFHLHFHVLPRDSGLELDIHARKAATDKELADGAQRIRAALATNAR